MNHLHKHAGISDVVLKIKKKTDKKEIKTTLLVKDTMLLKKKNYIYYDKL